MATIQETTVVGVFEDRRKADQAVAELRRVGFRDDQIGVAMRNTEATKRTDVEVGTGDTYAEEGAATGLLTGLGLGALAGIGVLSGVVPVIGPAIAGGTLGILFSNAAAGAAVAGLAGALIGAGIPEEEAEYYHSEFQEGRTIVSVSANGRGDEARAILSRHGGYDMRNRGTTSTGTASRASSPDRTGDACASDTIQVKEERLRAEKQPVETGQVTVRKEVQTEHRTIDVPVEREEVVIERTPAHGRAAAGTVGAGDLSEGQEIRIPVREEKVNVSKEAVVTEEVRVGKRVVHDTERVSGDVRKESVKVEQKGDVNVRGGKSGK